VRRYGSEDRAYRDADWPAWLRLSRPIPEHSATIWSRECGSTARDLTLRCRAEREDGSVAGFVEVGARAVRGRL